MKLHEVTELMKQGQFTDELLAEFKKANRRSRGNYNRCQNCWPTAYEMPKENYPDSVALITMGLREYADSVISVMNCYHYLGLVYQRAGDYPRALAAYRRALELVRDAKCPYFQSYVPFYARLAAEMERECSGYRYTAELEEYYNLAKDDPLAEVFAEVQADLELTKALLESRQARPAANCCRAESDGVHAAVVAAQLLGYVSDKE